MRPDAPQSRPSLDDGKRRFDTVTGHGKSFHYLRELSSVEFIYDDTDGATMPSELTSLSVSDVLSAVAHAVVTGSVGCTYNDVKVSRLYTSTGYPNYERTRFWLVEVPVVWCSECHVPAHKCRHASACCSSSIGPVCGHMRTGK